MDEIDFAERKTEELMRHHLEDMAMLQKEAQMTFAFVTAAMSASFGYVLKLYEPTRVPASQNWVWLGPVLVLTLHLGIVAVYILLGALDPRDVQAPGNLPATLIGEAAPKRDLPELRKAEMWGLATRIEMNAARNQATAVVIRRARLFLITAPITFLVAWTAAQVWAAV